MSGRFAYAYDNYYETSYIENTSSNNSGMVNTLSYNSTMVNTQLSYSDMVNLYLYNSYVQQAVNK